MSRLFRLNHISIETTRGPVRYSFRGPLTTLVGPVGVGKSTLWELVKYCLGGNGLLTPVVVSEVSSVRVDLTTHSASLQLQRDTHGERRDRVHVADLTTGEDLGLLPVESREGTETVGDLLLDRIGIPRTTVTTARSGRTSRLTFNRLWTFMYLSQAEIDRSIAGHNDSYREPQRRALFELLFGMRDPAQARLEQDHAQAKASLLEAAQEEATISQFLADVGTPPRDMLREEEARLQAQARAGQERLAEMRRERGRRVDQESLALRDLRAGLESRLAEFRAVRGRLSALRRDRTAQERELEQQMEKLSRIRVASDHLAPIEFEVCPRCAQSIEDRPADGVQCRLCLQDLPQEYFIFPEGELSLSAADSIDERHDDLAAQLVEVRTLRDLESDQEGGVARDIQTLTLEIARLDELLSHRAAEPAGVSFAAALELSEEVAAARARLGAVEETLRLWDRYADAVGTMNQRKESVRAAVDAIKAAEERQRLARAIIDEIAEEYERIVQRIGVPGVRTVSISPRNYLPLINNGISLDRFAPPGGGIRTSLIVAYWLAVLTVAVRNTDTLFPSFLIIDSPRKSIGSNDKLAETLYRQLDTLADAYPGQLQILVSDSSVPSSTAKQYQHLSFDYDHPVISTIAHPGPAAVRTVQDLISGESRS